MQMTTYVKKRRGVLLAVLAAALMVLFLVPQSVEAATKSHVDPVYNNQFNIKITVQGGTFHYCARAIRPQVMVELVNTGSTTTNRTLKEGVEYRITGYDNYVEAYTFTGGNPVSPNPPTVHVEVIFEDGSTGMFEAYYEILPVNIKDAKLGWTRLKVAANSTAPYPVPEVKMTLNNGTTRTNVTLAEGVDYTVAYIGPAGTVVGSAWSTALANQGVYTVQLTGMGNYYGVNKKAQVTIVQDTYGTTDLMQATIVFSKKNKTFTYNPNKAIKPKITVKMGKKKLKAGKHYIVSYSNNNAAGTGRVSISAVASGGYTGTQYADFTILPLPISKCKIKGITDQTYRPFSTASGITCPQLHVKYGAATLSSGTDYFVYYKNNTKAGKATVVIDADNGSGNYTGTIAKHYKVLRKKLKVNLVDVELTFLKQGGTVVVYNTSQVDADRGEQPVVTRLVDHTTQLQLIEGQDFTVSYKNFRARYRDTTFKKKNPPTIIIKGKGNYSFTKKIHYIMQ